MKIILTGGDTDATRKWAATRLGDIQSILRGEWAEFPPDRAVRRTAREAIDLIRSSRHPVDVAVSGRIDPDDAAHLAWWASNRTDVEVIDAGTGSVWESQREEFLQYAWHAQEIAVRHLAGSLTTEIEDRAADTLWEIRSAIKAA